MVLIYFGDWFAGNFCFSSLLPPEPRLLAKKTKSSVFDAVSVPRSIAVIRRKVVSLAQEKHLDPVQPSFNHGEEARLLFLFQRLLESGRILSENAPLVTVDAHGILQKVNATKFLEAGSLNASELANIHTLSSELDFGLITNHGKATATLCFLNSTAGKTPIKVSLGKSGASFRDADNPGQLDIMTFEPSTLIIPPFTIGVFRVHLEVHRSDADLVRSEGFIGSKLEYRVNDRFKYVMPIVATMDPIEVDLVGDSIVDDVITIAVTPGKEHQHMALLGESTFQLLNSGKNKARFSFERVSQQKHDDGRVEFQPASGVLPGKSTLTVKAVFHPSLKQRVDHAFEFKVFE